MKKRSSVVLITLLLALSAIAIYIYTSKPKMSTVDGEGRNFSFKDTAAITKIFIADKEGRTSTLARTEKGWVVNDKFNCRSDAILNLMEAIRYVTVKMPVEKSMRKSVIKFMSSKALKVEIYVGDDLVRLYYVGNETPDGEGSYMLLADPETGENHKDPYVCFIPGFKGYLEPRYIALENNWRDRIVLNYIPPQIKEIKVQHLDAPADSSFSIELLSSTQFKLKSSSGTVLPFEEARMKQYLGYYQNISYEALITGMNKHLQDSLSGQKPFCIITLTTTNDGVKSFKFFRKQYTGDQDPEHGIHYTYDPNHLYLRFDNDREWAISQYFVFGKILITPRYFQTPVPVKK
jgi:hypothetical protein